MQNLMDFFSKISIITKSQIRYEGFFHQVNQQDQSVTLKNVISFGTEGRRPNNEIQPSSVVYEYIVFRSSDIEDIQAQGGSSKALIFQPPNQAPVSEQVSAQQTIVQGAAKNTTVTQLASSASVQPAQGVVTTQQTVTTYHQNVPFQVQVAATVPIQQPVQAPVVAQAQAQPQSQPANQRVVEDRRQKSTTNYDDLDFEEMNKQFTRVALNEGDKEVQHYKKDNFFDEISNTRDEKKFETREERFAQQQVDNDTFGPEYVRQNQYQRFFYNKQNNQYYGNQGGRRGGYNNNNNNNNSNYNNNNGGSNRSRGGRGNRGYYNYNNGGGRGQYNNANNGGGNEQGEGYNNYRGGGNSYYYQQHRNTDYQGGGGGGGGRNRGGDSHDANDDQREGSGNYQQQRQGNRRAQGNYHHNNEQRPYTGQGYQRREYTYVRKTEEN